MTTEAREDQTAEDEELSFDYDERKGTLAVTHSRTVNRRHFVPSRGWVIRTRSESSSFFHEVSKEKLTAALESLASQLGLIEDYESHEIMRVWKGRQ